MYQGISKAPKERHISVASHIGGNILLLWSWSYRFGSTVYKHSIPTGLGWACRNLQVGFCRPFEDSLSVVTYTTMLEEKISPKVQEETEVVDSVQTTCCVV